MLSALALTHNVLIADVHALARVRSVAFSFTMSIHDRVSASLAIRRTVHGHTVWSTLPRALVIYARTGGNRRRMPSRGKLAHGVYRLTLSPARGISRSIIFQVV